MGWVLGGIDRMRNGYSAVVRRLLRVSVLSVLLIAASAAGIWWAGPCRPSLRRSGRQGVGRVVVDRLVVKPGLAKRLADSLETAFRHGGDVVMVEELGDDGRGTMHLFSQKLACPDCGVSYPELAPRMFSFNSPHGACSACSGLGVQRSFDPARVVPDESLSLAGGALGLLLTISDAPAQGNQAQQHTRTAIGIDHFAGFDAADGGFAHPVA